MKTAATMQTLQHDSSMLALPKENTKTNILSSKILDVLKDATRAIEQTLAQSKNARYLYEEEGKNIIQKYQFDIEKLDSELERIVYLFEDDKKKSIFCDESDFSNEKKGQVSHALNFHLHRYENDGNSIFFIPSDTQSSETIPAMKKISSTGKGKSEDASIASSIVTTSRSAVKREKIKHEARNDLLQNLDKMYETETQLEQQLYGLGSEILTSDQKYEVKKALDRCRARRSNAIVTMINTYKPRLSSNGKMEQREISINLRMKQLGLDVPSIDEMFKEVENDASHFDTEIYDDQDHFNDTHSYLTSDELIGTEIDKEKNYSAFISPGVSKHPTNINTASFKEENQSSEQNIPHLNNSPSGNIVHDNNFPLTINIPDKQVLTALQNQEEHQHLCSQLDLVQKQEKDVVNSVDDCFFDNDKIQKNSDGEDKDDSEEVTKYTQDFSIIHVNEEREDHTKREQDTKLSYQSDSYSDDGNDENGDDDYSEDDTEYDSDEFGEENAQEDSKNTNENNQMDEEEKYEDDFSSEVANESFQTLKTDYT